MDTPTTIVLAATGAAALFPARARTAAVALAASGALIPDLDLVFLDDGLGKILHHRGPSHSIVFCAAAAPAMAWIARRVGARAPFGMLVAAAALGLAAAVLTDLATWWGTRVLWPFSRTRFGIGLVFIIDLWILGLALAPWILALVQKLRGRRFPRRAFAVAGGALAAYVLVCFGARTLALRAADERARAAGARVADVFPQPLSPLRWSLALESEHAIELVFIDLARRGEPLEIRRFARGDGTEAARSVDATELGRKLLWFYRLPIHELEQDGHGRTLVTYRDLAYEIWVPPSLGIEREPPFRYRFVLEGEIIASHGFVDERE